jgi:hypothetical protein
VSIPVDKHVERKFENELAALRPDGDYLGRVNAPWPGCAPSCVDSYDPGNDLLSDPANFHSNPGYLGTSTASMLQQAQPGSIYRVPGGGSGGHRPMPVGGPVRARVAGRSISPRGTRTVPPAGPAREPVSEGGPMVVSTGQGQF